MSRKSFKNIITSFLFLSIINFSFIPAKEIKWTAIGDSITYLNNHLNETGNRVKRGYLDRVKDQLPNINYINQGHNGWTTVGIAKEIEKLGIVQSDLYSIFLGTNDWWSGIPVGSINDYLNNTGTGTTCGAYRIIVNKIRTLNPNAKIVIITPMQRNDFVYVADANNNAFGSYKAKNGQTLEMFANAIIEIAKHENFPVVDLYHNQKLKLEKAVRFKRLKNPSTGEYQNYKYPASASIPFNSKGDDYPYPLDAVKITYDGLHPSDKGNKIIADNLIRVFKKIAQ
ncbi:SGNH/GDSL hydrolase family protein [Pedobacter miscanthi]|uniref:SGNH/GDSL hydrolase family protein n=1 Tax=Pedobacter miscanthi TaxID=2259170 RepID=A0A366KNR7_9SPHI|nr:SGNH/GDSL hydrolase family protein [Pedobacter miscanthi]RBQ02829.1 SGNH/GDSL hydrolase family protein [Pedobacter miscanthi]